MTQRPWLAAAGERGKPAQLFSAAYPNIIIMLWRG